MNFLPIQRFYTFLTLGDKTQVHAYSDWYYYMVINPVDQIQTVRIRPDPDPVHLYHSTHYESFRRQSSRPLLFCFIFRCLLFLGCV